MAVDWSKVQSKAAAHDQKHEDQKTDLIVQVGNAIGRIFDANPQDSRIDVVKAVLTQDLDKVKELLGISAQAYNPSGYSDKYIFVLDETGARTTAVLRDDMPGQKQYLDQGYTPVTENGLVVSLKKPAAIAPPPAPPAPADPELEVRHYRDGRVLRKVSRTIGVSDKKLEHKPAHNGTPEHFVTRPAVKLGR